MTARSECALRFKLPQIPDFFFYPAGLVTSPGNPSRVGVWSRWGRCQVRHDAAGPRQSGPQRLWLRFPWLARQARCPEFTLLQGGRSGCRRHGRTTPVRRKRTRLPRSPLQETCLWVSRVQNEASTDVSAGHISGHCLMPEATPGEVQSHQPEDAVGVKTERGRGDGPPDGI